MGKTIVLAILISVITVAIFMLAKSIFDIVKANRRTKEIVKFFAAHRPKTGAVIDYELVEGKTSVTYEYQGKYRPSKPNYRHLPDSCFVKLNCEDNGIKYVALYQIPKSDYKKLYRSKKEGSVIEIEPEWKGMDYQLIVE